MSTRLAHGGLQGTTKPTHYYVVHDEIGFKADDLQTLTNSVSYMFGSSLFFLIALSF